MKKQSFSILLNYVFLFQEADEIYIFFRNRSTYEKFSDRGYLYLVSALETAQQSIAWDSQWSWLLLFPSSVMIQFILASNNPLKNAIFIKFYNL